MSKRAEEAALRAYPVRNNFFCLDLKPCKENCPLRKTREEMEQQKETRI